MSNLPSVVCLPSKWPTVKELLTYYSEPTPDERRAWDLPQLLSAVYNTLYTSFMGVQYDFHRRGHVPAIALAIAGTWGCIGWARLCPGDVPDEQRKTMSGPIHSFLDAGCPSPTRHPHFSRHRNPLYQHYNPIKLRFRADPFDARCRAVILPSFQDEHFRPGSVDSN